MPCLGSPPQVADQLAVQFLQQRMPPPPLKVRCALSIEGEGAPPWRPSWLRSFACPPAVHSAARTARHTHAQRLAPCAQGAAAATPAGGSGPPTATAWVRLAQPGVARLVIDTEGPEPIAEVHHCMANRRDLHAKKPADEQVSGSRRMGGGSAGVRLGAVVRRGGWVCGCEVGGSGVGDVGPT